MKAMSALTLALAAGLCSTAAADIQQDVPAIGREMSAKSAGVIGHWYIKPATGEAVFTPAKEYLAAKAQRNNLRALGDDINGDGSPDFWVATNEDPCPIGTPSSPDTAQVSVDNETTQGDHHLYKAQTMGTDLLIESFTYKHWTDVLDTDTDSDSIGDGNTRGHGFTLTFWDKEDFFGKTTCFCSGGLGVGFTRTPIVSFSVTNVPGALTPPAPNYFVGYYLTFDLTGGGEFEIADSDGVGPASGFFNSGIAALDIDTNSDTIPDARSADTGGNGMVDWSYSIQSIQPTAPLAGEGLIGYGLAAPGIPGAPNQFDNTDGILDYTNRTDVTPDAGFDYTRPHKASIVDPMGTGFPFTSGIVPGIPSYISRFSLFFASLNETPDPTVTTTAPKCGGLPNSDFFGWGNLKGATFIGGLNCLVDFDNDTTPDGTPFGLGFLALSGALGGPSCPCDTDGNGILTLDDIDGFIAGFFANTAAGDCNNDGLWTLDDIDCFTQCFLAGCP